jgi:hypothetical protein
MITEVCPAHDADIHRIDGREAGGIEGKADKGTASPAISPEGKDQEQADPKGGQQSCLGRVSHLVGGAVEKAETDRPDKLAEMKE